MHYHNTSCQISKCGNKNQTSEDATAEIQNSFDNEIINANYQIGLHHGIFPTTRDGDASKNAVEHEASTAQQGERESCFRQCCERLSGKSLI